MGPFCGSWLASDSGTALGLALCGDAIAGKPAPTEGGGQWAFLWELAGQRFRHRAGSGIVRGCYRRQAGSYRGWRPMGPFCGRWLARDSGTAPCLALCGDAFAGKPAPTEGGGQWAFLWELAGQRFRHRAGSGIVRGCYRRQAGSYRGWRPMGPFCGRWLARDSGTAPCLALCGDAFAGKPAPTEGGGQWAFLWELAGQRFRHRAGSGVVR